MNYKFAKLVGLNTDIEAAQITISTNDPQNSFLGVIELTCDDAFVRGRQALSELVDSYLEERIDSKTEGERLKDSFTALLDKLKDVKSFSVVISSLQGKVLYIIGQGNIDCFLRRVDKISTLDSTSGQLVSGFLQERDRIFFSTRNLTKYLGDDLKITLELPFLRWEEEMEAKINAREDLAEDSPEVTEEQDTSLRRAGLIIDVEGDEILEDITPAKEMNLRAEEIENKFAYKVKIGDIFRKIQINKVTYYFIRNILPGSSLREASGKARLVLASILIMVVIAGAGLKFKSFKDQERMSNFVNFMQQAEVDFKEAQNLKTLNAEEAALKLSSAKEMLEKALKINSKDIRAQELKKQIDEESGNISQKFDGNFSEFLDLSLIKKGFKSQNISLSAGKILSLNTEDSTVVVIDISKKSQKILSGREKLGEAKVASINGSSAFVYSADKGIIRIDTGSQEASSAAKADKDWGKISDIVGFGGNIYLLDKEKNQIWKYMAVASGYPGKRNYLNEGVKVDFSSAARMQIESSIYVLKTGGEILRFTKGEPDHFSIGGLDRGIKDPKSIFTSSDTENLYILDSGNSRLVVLSKTGEYKAQYSGDKFGSATDLVADEIGKKVYLLEGSRIWQMDLK